MSPIAEESAGEKEPITQVAQASVVDERAVQVDLLQEGLPVIQEVPAELATPVRTEPLRLASKPEGTKDGKREVTGANRGPNITDALPSTGVEMVTFNF